jgi:hypothetical protein
MVYIKEGEIYEKDIGRRNSIHGLIGRNGRSRYSCNFSKPHEKAKKHPQQFKA